jgi:hypothetical protein
MKDIIKLATQKVSEGAHFSISFENRNLKINNRCIIKDGQYEGVLTLPQTDTLTALKNIETLYNYYRNSIPSARSEAKRKTYFQALPESQLTDEDMLYGQQRDEAQFKLELYVLCYILNGSLVWDEFAKDKWFWQSPNVEGLILLKTWIINQ